VLLETTDVPIADVAFASGFGSIRQFNATVREVFAVTPSDLRRRVRRHERPAAQGGVVLRLPYRAPLDGPGLIAFLGARAVPGVEECADGVYRRSLALPRGQGVVSLRPASGYVEATYELEDLRDLATAVQRCRTLLDLDSDPEAVVDVLGRDPVLGRIVRQGPGRRVPGAVEGDELAIRAVLGQQVSVAGAATLAGRLVRAYGEPIARPTGTITHVFPTAGAIASADPADLAMPEARRRAVLGLADALASGEIVLDAGTDRNETQRRLLALPGIGPWTTAYVAMRVLRDPDAFLPTDLGVRHALRRLGHGDRLGAATVARLAESWRPYRAYAVQHLWAHLGAPEGDREAVAA
jgi:AraC family transcriptional regulator of adaptative response / DNA-3-methyladenine glycosylase II